MSAPVKKPMGTFLRVVRTLAVLVAGVFIVGLVLATFGDTSAKDGGSPDVAAASTPDAQQVALPPTAVPLPPEPIVLSGRGQFASNPIKLPATRSVVTFTHSGRANFIVKGFLDGKEVLLVNAIGSYSGQTPLEGSSVFFDIQADGAWTAKVDVIPQVDSSTFQGSGDRVSGLFSAPPGGPWNVYHNGRANFIVRLHCAGGTDLIQNQIGPVDGSRIITPKRGPCYWEVKADGAWFLLRR